PPLSKKIFTFFTFVCIYLLFFLSCKINVFPLFFISSTTYGPSYNLLSFVNS
ncbi:hypothetical protein TUBRATIS_25810, partial [Tubulinosema ratisbonensis]